MCYDDWLSDDRDPFAWDDPPTEARCWCCNADEDEPCTKDCFCGTCLKSKPMPIDVVRGQR